MNEPSTQTSLRIEPADLGDARVVALLETHTATARAATAPGSAHALDLSGFLAADIRLWAAWLGEELLGLGALKTLSPEHGEIKSMHVSRQARGRGVGGSMLRHLFDEARSRGMRRVSLETGSWDYFEPARALYRRHGFVETGPFAGYVDDPNSTFMTRTLDAGRSDAAG
jgi:putative acetyltransferase